MSSSMKILNFNTKETNHVIIIQSEKYWYDNNKLEISYKEKNNEFILKCGCQTIKIDFEKLQILLKDIQIIKNPSDNIVYKYRIHKKDTKPNKNSPILKCESGNYFISLSDKPFHKDEYILSSCKETLKSSYISYLDNSKRIVYKNDCDLIYKNDYNLNYNITLDDIQYLLDIINNFYLQQSNNK